MHLPPAAGNPSLPPCNSLRGQGESDRASKLIFALKNYSFPSVAPTKILLSMWY